MRIVRRIINEGLGLNFLYELKYDNGYNWYYIGFGWENKDMNYPIIYMDADRFNGKGAYMIPFRKGDLLEGVGFEHH